jgi:hypothetical protein
MASITAAALADGVLQSAELLKRYLPGFDESNALKQEPHLPNHVTWCLGHLAITMHRISERIAQREIPLEWDPEVFSFGSQPSSDPKLNPTFAEVQRRFDAATQLHARTLRDLNDSDLDRTIPWGAGTTTVRDLAMRMMFHNGTHCGQIVDLRRALGMPRVIQ